MPIDQPSARRHRNRGKQKARLGDLSRQQLSFEEIRSLFLALNSNQPIMVAIIGASLTEHELERLLRSHFRRRDDETWKDLIAENGPLSSFFCKITMGYAFGIYDATTEKNLHIVRAVRNAFAHARHLIDFDHALVVEELNRALIPARTTKGIRMVLETAVSPKWKGRDRCVSLCMGLSAILMRRAAERLGRARRRKWPNLSPLAEALLRPIPSGSRGDLASGRAPHPADQSGDPSPSDPESISFGSLGRVALPDRKPGK